MFPFKTALNASTLFPFALDIQQQVRIAAEAGFAGFELWMKDIDAYVAAGGELPELRRFIADSGITLVNAIAFFPWADADATVREQGLAQAEREMRMLAALGCPAVAAPPYGDVADVTLEALATHFARLAELGRSIGVEPYLEFWGRAKKLSRLSEASFVAVESRVPDVKVLLDPFHMYVGGSDLNGLTYLNGASVGIVHVNDYPATPLSELTSDKERVFPGEGVAPTHQLASLLDRIGYHGYLSLELFIESFAGQSALEVARRGLESIKAAYTLDGNV